MLEKIFHEIGLTLGTVMRNTHILYYWFFAIHLLFQTKINFSTKDINYYLFY